MKYTKVDTKEKKALLYWEDLKPGEYFVFKEYPDVKPCIRLEDGYVDLDLLELGDGSMKDSPIIKLYGEFKYWEI